jgi:uncharacterized iron-regulated protein
MKLKSLTVLAAALTLAGCAQLPAADGERIVEVATGREISRAELLAKLRASDYVLLGEQHDNALHHQRRGALLKDLGAGAPVVAEHLTRGLAVPATGELLPRLEAAGFEAKGWRWPLHEPLFAPAAAAGHRLLGGNVPRELARQIARQGEAALPAELKAVTTPAPLDEAAGKALDADLVQGHCGMLGGERLVGMRWAQRARDAAMWLSLREAAALGKPAVLLAGNGHVRLDYGVPQLAGQARLLSVGFVDSGAKVQGAPYSYVWLTAAPAGRGDPCEGMKQMMQQAPKVKSGS